MWFKNLYLFKLEENFKYDADGLQEKLATKEFSPCLSNQRESFGWSSPFGRKSDALVMASQGHLLCRMARQERLLPAAVITKETDNRVEMLEEKEGRSISKRERRDIKEQIEFELLPQAFTRTQFMDAWIDTQNNWVIINTTSAPRAESLTKLLRNTIDSLPLKLPDTEITPATSMTTWLEKDNLPNPFEFGQECQFKSNSEEKSTVTFKKHQLSGEEIDSNLKAGKYVSQLEMIWDEKISFVLTEDLMIKKLRFLDVMEDHLQEQDFDSHAEKMDIEFTLMTGESAKMIKDLMKVLS